MYRRGKQNESNAVKWWVDELYRKNKLSQDRGVSDWKFKERNEVMLFDMIKGVRKGVSDINENGGRLVEVCTERELVIISIFLT